LTPFPEKAFISFLGGAYLFFKEGILFDACLDLGLPKSDKVIV
jgi:hypothetical protein